MGFIDRLKSLIGITRSGSYGKSPVVEVSLEQNNKIYKIFLKNIGNVDAIIKSIKVEYKLLPFIKPPNLEENFEEVRIKPNEEVDLDINVGHVFVDLLQSYDFTMLNPKILVKYVDDDKRIYTSECKLVGNEPLEKLVENAMKQNENNDEG